MAGVFAKAYEHGYLASSIALITRSDTDNFFFLKKIKESLFSLGITN
jgi:hypothetical protein